MRLVDGPSTNVKTATADNIIVALLFALFKSDCVNWISTLLRFQFATCITFSFCRVYVHGSSSSSCWNECERTEFIK